MQFCIQASNPRFEYLVDADDTCLSEAVESIFPLNTENAILTWNNICIPLSYKYDISYMIDDSVRLIDALQNNKAGKLIIHWLPDTFRCDWIVEWSDDEIKINSKWECTVGHLEDILNEKNNIIIPIVDFINEWKKVFEIIIKGLKSCGYDMDRVRGGDDLINQYKKIQDLGVLYK